MRDRLLFFCTYPDVTRQLSEVYFLNVTTGEIVYIGRKEDKYYGKGYLFPEPLNASYYNSTCHDWIGDIAEGGWNACYWKVDEPSHP